MKAGMVKSMTGLATALGLAGVLVLGAMSSYPVSAAQTAQGQGQAANASAAVLQLLGARPAATAGQSATQLPDGGWLLLGGTTGTGAGAKPSAGAWRVDPVKGGTTALGTQLGVARSGHTATLLPDGTVLVLGGTTASGVTNVAERFDPSSGSFTTLGAAGVLARSGHTATVLADGRVLVAGGVDAKGAAVREVEVYEPAGGGIERVAEGGARQQHRATLLPEGGVLLWGGTDAQGQALPRGALYDAAAQRWSAVTAEAAAQAAKSLGGAGAPAVLESQPASGAAQVPVGQRLMLRFSKRMDVSSLNAATVTVVGPSGAVKLDAVGVEGGVLLFVTPRQELLPNTAFTLFVQGAKDEFGQALPMQAIGFRTAALGKPGKGNAAPGSAAATPAPVIPAPRPAPAASAPVVMDEDERWIPGRSNYGGNWTSGRRHQAERTLPQQPRVRWALHGDPAFAKLRPADVAARRLPRAPQARMGEGTSVSGQVLRLNGKPLANVTLAIGERRTRTDANGEFTLRNAPSGRQILVIDGGTANNGEYRYGRYEYGMEVKAGEDNALPFVSWMTPLDTANTVTIASPTTAPVVLTNPAIPGLELRIPAGTVIRDTQGRIVTELSLTAIPVDQPPFPLPAFPVPVYFTVQPGGSHLVGIDAKSAKGAQLIYPNFAGSKPGTRVNFWDYDATERGWFMYGQGAVSADGKQVVPDPGVVIYEFTGAMIAKPTIAPTVGPCDNSCKAGDPVDVFTGLFQNDETDVVINDVVPITISRHFRPGDEASRAFGMGTGLHYDSYLVGDAFPYTYQYMMLPNGGSVLFTRISGGGGYSDAVYRSEGAAGTPNEGAILKWDTTYPGGTWSVTLKDGTVYYFPESYNSTDFRVAALVAIRDRNGNLTQLDRTGGLLTKVTSPNGRTVSLTYDAARRISKITDDIGREWKYEYDTAGRLSKAIDPLNNFRQYTYQSQAVNPATSIGGVSATTGMLSVIDKRGNAMVTNVYDANGRVVKQTYADGSTMLFSYTLTAVQPARSRYVCTSGAFTLGVPGATLETTCGGSAPTISIVSQADVTDERGMITRYVFDKLGAASSVTTALGLPEQRTVSYQRDPVTGTLTSMVDGLGRTTSFEYDSLGNVTKKTRLSGTAGAVSTSGTYDAIYSRLTSITDPNGNTRRFDFDAYGNLIREIDGLGHAVTTSYDGQGRPVRVENALGQGVALGYAAGDLVSFTDPTGHRTTLFADAVGRLKRATDALDNATSIEFDALDRPVSQTNARGEIARMTYDANGNILSQTDEKLNANTYVYDKRNRVISRTDPLQQSSTIDYEPGGKPSRSVDRKGQLSATITRDGLGRSVQVGFGATEAAPSAFRSTATITWDADNRPTKIVDSVSGTLTREYDGLNRLLSITSPQGRIDYTYDAGGRRTSMSVQGQPVIRYTWDAADRITRMEQEAGSINGNVAQVLTFGYDVANRRTDVGLANGVTGKFTYDAAGRLTAIVYKNAAGTVIGEVTHAYDANGRRISAAGTLDGGPPDIAASGTEFDANGRLTKWNGRTLSYDANGNLTSDGEYTYVWDERDRLSAVNGAASTVYQYDPIGRRVSRTSAGVTSRYLLDHANVAQLSVGASTFSLLGGPEMDDLHGIVGPGRQEHLLKDALGSVRTVTDGAQVPVATIGYGAYGQVQSTSGVAPEWQYTGRENDGNGLYFYRARYYSPSLGRFISEDPLGWAAGQSNRYAYVGGDPVGRTDPSGLAPQGAIDFMNFFKDAIGPMPTWEIRRDGRPWGAGCGNASNDWIVPDLFPKSCEKHDDCYAKQCGQDFCDDQFLKNMREERPEAWATPWIYYASVHFGGGKSYLDAAKELAK